MKLARYAVVGAAIFGIAAMFAASSYADCGHCGAGDASAAVVGKGSEFVGKVVEVTVAEPAKGIADGSLTVADGVGKTTKFTVKETVKILAGTADALTLNQLKIGDKVNVVEKDGEAQAIKVVE